MEASKMPWKPYSERTDRSHDFEVAYRFLPPDEGGRKTGAPFQGYRCDFAYQGDQIATTGVYAIWPEFQDPEGNLLPDGVSVPMEGTARMWILSDQLKGIHRNRLRPGVRGYFTEGSRRVGEVLVTRIVDFNT
jgi:hypothetical protein